MDGAVVKIMENEMEAALCAFSKQCPARPKRLDEQMSE